MPTILTSADLSGGRKLLLAESSARGGRWARPVYLTLIITDGTPYTTSPGRGVLEVLARRC